MTNTSSPLARLLAGGCALALTLSACGGSSDSSGAEPSRGASTVAGGATTPDSGDEAAATTTVADTSDVESAATGGYTPGPLDQFLGFGVKSTPEDQAVADQQMRESEQLIVECMSAQGFEYRPYDPTTGGASFVEGPWSLPPDEFAAQYGYGISTIERDPNDDGGDPNAAAIDAMSVAEKQAYYRALYGDMLVVDDNGEITKRGATEDAAVAGPAPVEPDSCSAKANAAVYGTTEQQETNTAFAPLQDAMGALYDRVDNDQRVVDARAAWSACLADAGFPGFADIYDPASDVQSKATELMGDDLVSDGVDPAALDGLRTYEVSLAVADLGCRQAYDDVHDEVRDEVEDAFIDEHRVELEQYRDAIATGDVGVG